ncbi:host cell division inhibitor Icd-like protein [Raoultella sp. YJ]|uniref:host cell division inhibitor Icd-like protein n=1 Tax=Raoultella sp. YJ TaxID=1850565 RepID=UPI0011132BA3|nr:host cell division inhibitor Icd-like protein [Raoultella sp. YJ]
MITSIQGNSLSMAGLLANVSTLRVLRSHGNLSKPVTLRVTEGGAQNAGWNFATSTNAGKRSGSDYLEDTVSSDGDGCGAYHITNYKLSDLIKKGLRLESLPVYGYSAPAKSGAGIGVLITCIVPTRTKRVFLSAKFLHTQIMVGWMRLPKGRPVSIQAGYANLVQLTTSPRLASLGGEFTIHCIEDASMATTPTQSTQFIWIIAAIRRDSQSVTVKNHVTAASEREARRTLVRDHVCFFAGRIRLTEVDHA